jgi:hypothetical protein
VWSRESGGNGEIENRKKEVRNEETKEGVCARNERR